MQPDERVIKAIASLKGDPRFMEFINWLTEREGALVRGQRGVENDIHLRWNQGRLQELGVILESVKGAESAVIAAKEQKVERKW